MTQMSVSGVGAGLRRIAMAAAITGLAAMGATAPANAMPAGAELPGMPDGLQFPIPADDPGCEMFGWRHPMCAGGAFEDPVDDGIPGDNAAIGGIPAPASVPNVDGSLSPPGMPGDV